MVRASQPSLDFAFAGFPDAVAFVTRLVPGSEEADHHPDLAISYRHVTVTFTTHSEGGVTDKPTSPADLADPTSVAIGVSHLEDVQAFDFTVDLPDGAEVAAVKQAELPAAAGDCSLVWAQKDGTLRISLACLTPIRGGGALLAVRLRGEASGTALSQCVFDETEVPCRQTGG